MNEPPVFASGPGAQAAKPPPPVALVLPQSAVRNLLIVLTQHANLARDFAATVDSAEDRADIAHWRDIGIRLAEEINFQR